jgi:hypothetical protein
MSIEIVRLILMEDINAHSILLNMVIVIYDMYR